MARVTVEISEKGLKTAVKKLLELADTLQLLDKVAAESLREEAKKLQKDVHFKMKAAAIATMNAIVPATAVKTGLARGNWEARIQKTAPAGKEKQNLDPSGIGVKAKANSKIASADLKPGQKIYITNGADHIEKLNTGTGFSKPGGFDVLAAQAGRKAIK